jgi:hypothetical protein
VLRYLGFEERGTVTLLLVSKVAIPFTISGGGDEDFVAQTPISLCQDTTAILLVIQADPSFSGLNQCQARIIASAIAAFRRNNATQ